MFKDQLHKSCSARGLTFDEAIRKADLPEEQVTAIVNGHSPNLDASMKLAAVLSCPLEELAGISPVSTGGTPYTTHTSEPDGPESRLDGTSASAAASETSGKQSTFVVPVRFSGRIEYHVRTDTEDEAMDLASDMAAEEERLGELSDIDYDVKRPVHTY